MDDILDQIRKQYASSYPAVILAMSEIARCASAEITNLREQVEKLQAEVEQLEAVLSMEYDTW